jgi:hypothetical protein
LLGFKKPPILEISINFCTCPAGSPAEQKEAPIALYSLSLLKGFSIMAIAQKSAAKKAIAAKPAAKKAVAPAAKKAVAPVAAKKAVAPAAPAAKKASAHYAPVEQQSQDKAPRAHIDRASADDSALVAIMKGMREACEQKKIQKLVNAIRAQGFAVSMGRAEKLIPLALMGAKSAAKNGGNSKGR